ncbi:MAG: ISAzo13 family transposase, partial [Isosphaeraceae bacterium]
MDTLTIVASVRQKFDLLRPIMTERMRRQWAASEALALPRGGMTLVAQATGLSRTTIWAGVRELQNPSASRRWMGDPRRSRW